MCVIFNNNWQSKKNKRTHNANGLEVEGIMGSVMVEAKTKYKNINPSKALFLHLRSMEIKQNKTKKSNEKKRRIFHISFFCGLLFGGKFVMRMLHNEMLQKK